MMPFLYFIFLIFFIIPFVVGILWDMREPPCIDSIYYDDTPVDNSRFGFYWSMYMNQNQ